jgi:hypothetical protein
MRDPTDPPRETTMSAVHASPMAGLLPNILTLCVASGAFLGLIGPLGTHELGLATRLGYWIVAIVAGGLLGWATTWAVLRWLPLRDRPWLTIFAVTTLMTPPGVVLIWVWCRVALGLDMPLDRLPALAGQFVLISLAMTALSRFLVPAPASATPAAHPRPAAAVPAPGRAPFLDRLPPRLRGATLHAVQAEDHYLRVHTDRGSDLILLRLGDALAELAPLDGAQTHRSWWVARQAVRTVRRHDGRATLTLDGGLDVPVSRAHVAALRATGWL